VIGSLLPLAWRNLWRAPRRTWITLAVVVLGVWAVLTFDVMIRAFAEGSRQETLRLLTGEGQIHAAGFLDDPAIGRRFTPPPRLEAALRAAPITAHAQRLRIPAMIQSEYRSRSVTLLGVDPVEERAVSDLPGQMLRGRYLSDASDEGLVIGQDLARRLRTQVGRRVVVLTEDRNGALAERGFVVIGLFGNTRAAQDAYIFTGRAPAQALVGTPGEITEIAYDLAPHAKPIAGAALLRRSADGLDVKAWTELSPLAAAMESLSETYTAIWLGIVFVLMGIGVVNTQLMAVLERTGEFGLLQALGMRPGAVVIQVLLESALLMAAGVAAGVLLALLTVAPLSGGFDMNAITSAADIAGGVAILHPSLEPLRTALLAGVLWFLGVLATLWPAWTAARTRPAIAMGAAP
jgi:ABC-type lipoprotein release transport system permease subunit